MNTAAPNPAPSSEATPDAQKWTFDPMHLTEEDVALLNSFNRDAPDEPYFSPYIRLVVPNLPPAKVRLYWKVSNAVPYPSIKPRDPTPEECWAAIPKDYREEVRLFVASQLGLITEDEALDRIRKIRARLIEESYSL
jgi:hypothetical protein